MTRNLKFLGLTLVAVFAMSAVAAQAAMAAEYFHSEAHETVVTGEADPENTTQNFVIYNSATTEEIGFVSCDELELEGLIVGEGETNTNEAATVHPTYPEKTCKSNPEPLESINTEGCHYKFGANTNAEGHGEVGIECGTGSIKVTISGCTVHVPTQVTKGGVHYANKEGKITGTATVSGIYTSSGFICALGGVPTEGHFTYEGSATMEGFVYEGGTTGSYVEGNSVSISQG